MKHEVVIYCYETLIHSYAQETGNVPGVGDVLTFRGVKYRIVSAHQGFGDKIIIHRINVEETKEKRPRNA